MGIPVLPTDQLRLEAIGDATYGVRFSFNLRTKNGNIETISADVQIVTPLVNKVVFKDIVAEAELFSGGTESLGDAITASPPNSPGRCYVVAYLIRQGTIIQRVLAGYFASRFNPSYPGPQINAGEGPGFINTISGTAPAAGADISDQIPQVQRWKLKAIEAVLVTSAAAANRTVNLFIDDAAATITRRVVLTDTTAQTATLTRTHAWYPGTDNFSTASATLTDTVTILAKFPMVLQDPGITLFTNNRIRTVTANIDVADQWGAARYWVESWIGVF